MFESFQKPINPRSAKRRLLTSWAAATGAFTLLTALAIAFEGEAKEATPEEEPLQVVFASEVPKPEPPPEPIVEKDEPAPPPSPAPVAAPAHIPRTAAKARPPKPIEAVKEIPKEAPKEGDAADFAVAAAPVGEGDPAGRVGGTGDSSRPVEAPKPAPVIANKPKAPASKPIRLPENATPPKMLTAGSPSFPAAMKSAGKEGLVILKVVIRKDGRITQWQILQGEEPFLTAALDWVKETRWEPAISADGERLPVFKILRIPFRLRI